MFINFFLELKKAGLPVSLREYLTLMEGMDAGLAEYAIDDFYYLARACLVKDELNLDKFDRVFGHVFKGLEQPPGQEETVVEIPASWLEKLAERLLTDEEKALIQSMGGFEALMEALRQRVMEQQGRHQGGSKWIGTAGTSPFGAWGFNPEGVRIGQHESRHRKAVKIWERRDFRNLDGDVEIGVRNIKVALRRLRRFAREGAATELDLPATITSTAKRGYLDLAMRPERHNAVKVLLFLDVGGSMDPFVRVTEELFSAARAEFKHLEYFYFHNCIYERVWRDNHRRFKEVTATWDVLHTYPHDYKVVFVGDAAMSAYELTEPGGSIEHWNPEAGNVWLKRILDIYPRAVWLNPTPADWWNHTYTTRMIEAIFDHRMFPLTLDGLDRAIRCLVR